MLPRSQPEDTLEPSGIRLFECLNVKQDDGSIEGVVTRATMLQAYTSKLMIQRPKGIRPIDGLILYFVPRTAAGETCRENNEEDIIHRIEPIVCSTRIFDSEKWRE